MPNPEQAGTKKEINHESIPPRREKHEKNPREISCFQDFVFS